jgi:hypothetical protein
VKIIQKINTLSQVSRSWEAFRCIGDRSSTKEYLMHTAPFVRHTFSVWLDFTESSWKRELVEQIGFFPISRSGCFSRRGQ